LKYHTETPCRHTCRESESQTCQWLIKEFGRTWTWAFWD